MQGEQNFAFNLQANMMDHGLWDIDGTPCLENTTKNPVIQDIPLCSICLSDVSAIDFQMDCCLSKFHHDCLNKWIIFGSRKCPNCRSNI